LDVGGDVIQDMVAGNEDLSAGLIEANVPQGVTRSGDAAEMITTAFHDVPVIQEVQFRYPLGLESVASLLTNPK
jgi:hypothetical protein